MNCLTSGWYKRFRPRKEEIKTVILGLDAAGKTSILRRLLCDQFEITVPTVGLNVERIQHKDLVFALYDVGGQKNLRVLWRQYLKDAKAIVFVVDCGDKERISEAREELQRILEDESMKDIKLLVFANKQDNPTAVRSDEIIDKLQLKDLQHCYWHVEPCLAINGVGVSRGLDWLASQFPAASQR